MEIKKLPSDILVCEYCNKNYSRAHRSQHRKSKFCQAFQQAGKVIREAILDNVGGKKSFSDLICDPYTDKDGNTVYLTKRQFDFQSRLGKIMKDKKEETSNQDQKQNRKQQDPTQKRS